MKTKEFNKIDYLKEQICAFLHSYSKGLNQVSGFLATINKDKSGKDVETNTEKRQILERCLALFRSQKFKDLVESEKEKYGILNLKDVDGQTRLANLHKISELSQILTNTLCEIILGDLKRKYNMSALATTKMVSTKNNSTEKDVTPIHKKGLLRTFTDYLGQEISVQEVGRLEYNCKPSADDYISIFLVTKHHKDGTIKEYKELFSHIDLLKIPENQDYTNIVANTLLSDNNIELSNADGYIGELHIVENSNLEDGKEKFKDEFYTYKIPNSKVPYCLVYDGVKIEAIRAYKEQEKQQKQEKQKDDDAR